MQYVSKDLLREIRREDDHRIGIAVLERTIHLVDCNRDAMQFIRARQQGVNERIDTVTTRSSRVHNRQGTHAAGSGKNEVQQGHDEQGDEKDQRQCTSITQHLSNNAAGERQNTRETHFWAS